MRLLPTALFCLAAAGCGGPDAETVEVTANQIERVSTPRVETEDPAASVRLRPLSGAEIADQGGTAAGSRLCRFERNGEILFAAWDNDAMARVGGEVRHFVQSIPVGTTGGFFEDRQISVSIGLVRPGSAAARIAVTNRRNEARREMTGEWLCGQ